MPRLVTTLSLATLLSALSPASAQADRWNLDPAHSFVGFTGRHLVVSTVRGRFTRFSGFIELDDKDISKSVVQVEIDSASIDSDNADRDRHLRSADFLDVEKFPKISFKSTKVERVAKEKTKLRVTGDLTIRGVSKSVVLDVDGGAEAIRDPWGGSRRAFSATTKINRKDFGVSWAKTIDGGALVAGEEITIIIEAGLLNKNG